MLRGSREDIGGGGGGGAIFTSVTALAMSALASSSEPAAEVRLEDRESRSSVFTETLPPATTTGVFPPHMVQE
jgi:hypothetical protein